MRLRPYINDKDFEYVSKWVSNERIHALWCANLISYPLSKEGLREVLDKDAREWGGCAYTITDDAGTPIGFFVYSINNVNNSGFLKFVILDSNLRGKGLGTQMLTLILKYAFDITSVSAVRLNVFDVNTGARKCYSNVGFIEESIVKWEVKSLNGYSNVNMLKQLNAAIEYIEANLCAEFDLDTAAGIACVTADSFIRFFSYMTGMTLTEYIRRRRLTLAAQDLQHGKTPIIDIAMKYGYDSATAFSRAFAKQHGITPSVYRKEGGSLKVYPPASFHIMIKGAKEMDFRIIELEDTLVYGVSKQYEGQGYKTREELRHSMWADNCDDVPGQLCEGRWNQPGSTSYDGVWYGVWQDGKYMIARERSDTKTDKLEMRKLPAGTYAAFKTECGGLAWEEFPKLFELIFDSWLPASEYKQKYDLAIEVLHLWTDHDLRQKNRYYEIWIPVELK